MHEKFQTFAFALYARMFVASNSYAATKLLLRCSKFSRAILDHIPHLGPPQKPDPIRMARNRYPPPPTPPLEFEKSNTFLYPPERKFCAKLQKLDSTFRGIFTVAANGKKVKKWCFSQAVFPGVGQEGRLLAVCATFWPFLSFLGGLPKSDGGCD
jgi:hypothetical protein